MVTRDRRIDRANRLIQRNLVLIGEELREARWQAALTQSAVGAAVGISHSHISRIERGLAPRVSYALLVRIGAVLGLDLPLRAFPAGEPIRDAGQLALLGRLRSHLPAGTSWRTEAPLGIPRDQRAWDAVIGIGVPVPVEAETRLRDIQALTRRLTLKMRDSDQQVVILLVAGTRHNRHVLRLAAAELAGTFPVRGRDALAALQRGNRPIGNAIIIL